MLVYDNEWIIRVDHLDRSSSSSVSGASLMITVGFFSAAKRD